MRSTCGQRSACSCGCCAGVAALTPASTANRPGLGQLAYRVGTHGTFLETMRARLSAPGLSGHRTRAPDDPSLAVLDAWATVADVLTFYQERIANEGYLRTAVERRSLIWLAGLVGYRPRPGIASTAYLAFTMEDGTAVEVPAGTRAQSVPGPGEAPQSFETSDPLRTRAEWNVLRPRLTRPQVISPVTDDFRIYLAGTDTGLSIGDLLVVVSGTAVLARVTAVQPDGVHDRTAVTVSGISVAGAGTTSGTSGDAGLALLTDIITDLTPATSGVNAGGQTALRVWTELTRLGTQAVSSGPRRLHELIEVEYLPLVRDELASAGTAPLRRWLGAVVSRLERTRDELAGGATGPGAAVAPPAPAARAPVNPFDLVGQLLRPPSVPPPSRQRMGGAVEQRFTAGNDATYRVLSALRPALAETLLPAWKTTSTTAAQASVYPLRTTAALFGHDVPRQFTPNKKQAEWNEWIPANDEGSRLLYLDTAYPRVRPGGWVVVATPPAGGSAPAPSPQLWEVSSVTTRPRSAYGLNGVTTTVVEVGDWWEAAKTEASFGVIRGTRVHIGDDPLALAEEPLPAIFPVPEATDRIPLDSLQAGLEPGRWLIVSGERVLRDASGAVAAAVPAAELVMLAAVEHGADPDLPADTPHTTLVLASPLAYEYRRETVAVYANVAKSTHGESHVEIIGSGDSGTAPQRFPLTYAPLTFVPSSDAAGAASTLEVRVNGVRWHECEDLTALGPTDRGYLARTDADLVTTVTFGDGWHGARPPTGIDNVEASYRSQIGRPGIVGAGRISVLATTPEGARSVVNPLPATGGADPESEEQIRVNVPLTLTAFDRLVSVRDYEDFSRTFAGIGKALAVRGSVDGRRTVEVTVAGTGDTPLSERSDTFVNLRRALRSFGDPGVPVRVMAQELLLLVIDAGIGVLPDHRFDLIEPKVRAALLAAFAFDKRGLGQDVYASEVISAIQAVEGVSYVDLNKLGVTAADPAGILGLASLGEPPPRIDVFPPVRRAGTAADNRAELAILSPKVPETLLLREAP